MIDRGAPEPSALGRLLRTWLPIAAAAGLVAIVALTSRTTSGAAPVGLDTGFVLTAIEVVGYVTATIGIVAFIPAIILLRFKRRQLLARDRDDKRDVAPWWARLGSLALALAVLAVQVALLTVVAELLRARGLGATDGPVDPGDSLDPNALGAGRDATSLVLAFVLLTVLGLALLVLAIRWRRSDAARPEEAAEVRLDLTADAVEVSLDALRREPDPRRAIIAAYAAMERSMTRAGIRRRPSEAPIEYLRRMLAGAMADAEDVRTMTHLFEVAKFSHHAVDESMRAGAIGALDRIRTATMRPA
jgi:hypothetical protein